MQGTIAQELVQTVEKASQRLTKFKQAEVENKPAPDKWSKKEILGHLIDSASNNHQRFVRAQYTERLEFPPYEQDEWLRIQQYNAGDWHGMVELWRLYNQHLAHVIAHIPSHKLTIPCHIESSEPVTLEFLVKDYLDHMKHHLKQLGAISHSA
jgi:hypothetical protein